MVLDNILGKRVPRTQVMLTPLGRMKMEEKDIRPDTADGKVLWYIRDHPQSNLAEIADDTGMSYSRVKDILNKYSSKDFRWIDWV